MIPFLGWMKEEIPFDSALSQRACIPPRGTAQGVLASAYMVLVCIYPTALQKVTFYSVPILA